MLLKKADLISTYGWGPLLGASRSLPKRAGNPAGLPAGQRLAYYARFFDYVELNSSFYAIPVVNMCEKWVRETPGGFLVVINQ